MTKLPQVKPKDVVRALEKAGFVGVSLIRAEDKDNKHNLVIFSKIR